MNPVCVNVPAYLPFTSSTWTENNVRDAFTGLSPYAPLAIAQGLSLPAEPSPQSSGEAEGSDQVPSANLLGEPCSTQGCEQTDAIMMSQMPTTNVGAEMQLQMPSLVANPATTMNEYQVSFGAVWIYSTLLIG